jgi:hypothetical protein
VARGQWSREDRVATPLRASRAGSAKPVRSCSPRLGRFDSGAAPLNGFQALMRDPPAYRVDGDRCSYSADVRWKPPHSGHLYPAVIPQEDRALWA